MGSIRVIKASAGSGKTYRLVYEYINTIIDNPNAYRNILAVTFTNKATSEMKSRIIKQLYLLTQGSGDYMAPLVEQRSMAANSIKQRASVALTSILQDYSHFAVMTIDRFFQRIIRAFIHELGVDAGFTIELQTDSILSQATDELIESIGEDSELKEWIIRFVEERISENRHWDIRKDINSLGKELFNDSRNSLTKNTIDSKQLLEFVSQTTTTADIITRTMQAIATAAITTIERRGLSLDDFPYKGGSAASYLYKVAKDGVVAYGKRATNSLSDDKLWFSAKSPRRDELEAMAYILRPLMAQIMELYDNNIRYINSVSQLRANYRTYALLNDLSTKIEAICKEQSIIPISETNSIIERLISENDTPFIFEKTGNRFDNYMIDEFQDTADTQWRNFKPLLDNVLSQSDDTPVLLVGDIKQSIYRWRGGDWRILGEQISRLYGDNVSSDDLDTNRRSYGRVVEFNNHLISSCVAIDSDNLDHQLNSALNESAISTRCHNELSGVLKKAYNNYKQNIFKAPQKGYVTITEQSSDDFEQQPYVITKIKELQDRGYAARDITILVRQNDDGVAVANTILEYKSANPDSKYNFSVITGEALLLKNADVTGFIFSVFELSCSNDQIYAAVYNRWLGRTVSTKLTESELRFIEGLRLLSLDEAFEHIVMQYDLNRDSDNISYLQAIHELIISLSGTKVYDIPTLLVWWHENKHRRSLQLPENNDAINISTIHKSKGLQYQVVIIPKCSWELNTHTNSIIWSSGRGPFESLPKMPMRSNSKLESSYFAEEYYREHVLSHIDNINLLYVALTRAIGELHILLPSGSGNKIDSIIKASLVRGEGDSVSIRDLYRGGEESMVGRAVSDNAQTVYSFGVAEQFSREAIVSNPTPSFPVRRPEGRLKFKVHNDIDIEGHGGNSLSQRSYGILMHTIFESITSRDQLLPALHDLRVKGKISATEEEYLSQRLSTLLSSSLTESWFDGNWSQLLVERSILTPTGATYRPDRVLIKGDQVVVIDYKFGLLTPRSHARALQNYMLLISEMGYKNICGYLWYVEQNRVEQVAL